MRRPWQIWLAYLALLAMIVAGVGWLSVRALQADRAETAAREQAGLEERVRLALWRMDGSKVALVSDESARPYFTYATLYGADPIFGLPPGKTAGKGDPGPQWLSPLARAPAAGVLAYFQIGADGRMTSPQIPEGTQRKDLTPAYLSEEVVEDAERQLRRVERLAKREELLARLPGAEQAAVGAPVMVARADREANPTNPANRSKAEGQQRYGPSQRENGELAVNQADPVEANQGGIAQQAVAPNAAPFAVGDFQAQQRARGNNEYQARSQYVANTVNSSVYSQSLNYNGDLGRVVNGREIALAAREEVQTSRMTPLWIGGELFLARRVKIGGREIVQGLLLDWPAIRGELLAGIADLLPGADLVPADEERPAELDLKGEASASRLLASLPVKLIPGLVEEESMAGWSPVRQSLVVAWSCMCFGAIAVAMLLQGVLRLSERRAAFVSAVTHELRTPLTTFRMYAEMLAEKMVPDEARQQEYLETLRVEADRLTHLVDNVLAYARLERGNPAGRQQKVSVERLVRPHADRLAERARQAGLELKIEADEGTLAAAAWADPAAVEQILFNLVDNACKYAGGAEEPWLHLEGKVRDGRVLLSVRDHGPGVSPELVGRLFQPFRKSSAEAAHSAPGVGLGLALSRRLAREMGGELRYAADPGGARFVLELRGAGGDS